MKFKDLTLLEKLRLWDPEDRYGEDDGFTQGKLPKAGHTYPEDEHTILHIAPDNRLWVMMRGVQHYACGGGYEGFVTCYNERNNWENEDERLIWKNLGLLELNYANLMWAGNWHNERWHCDLGWLCAMVLNNKYIVKSGTSGYSTTTSPRHIAGHLTSYYVHAYPVSYEGAAAMALIKVLNLPVSECAASSVRSKIRKLKLFGFEVEDFGASFPDDGPEGGYEDDDISF